MITQKGNKNMLFTLFLDGEEYGERIDSRFLGVFSSFPAVIAHVSSRLMYQGLRWEDYPFRLCHEFNYIFSPGQEELVRRGEKDNGWRRLFPTPGGSTELGVALLTAVVYPSTGTTSSGKMLRNTRITR